MESEAKQEGLKELQRWHKVVREKKLKKHTATKQIRLENPDIMVKVKVIEYPDSKWYVKK
jgi:hypothetical protein